MQIRTLLCWIGFQLICLSVFAQQSLVHKHGSSIQSIETSPVNKSLAAIASDDHTILLWDFNENFTSALTGHTDQVNAVAFSPDGKTLASGSNDRTIKLWDIKRKQNITTLQHNPPGHGPSNITSVSFSPDGNTLASAGYLSVKLWNVSSHREIDTLKHDDWVHAVVFSRNGKYLAAVDGKKVKVWDFKNQQIITELEADTTWIGAIAFSPNSQLFASAGSEGRIKIWQVEDWKVIGEMKDVSSVSDLVFSQDSKRLVSAGNDVNLWSVESHRNIVTFTEHNGWVMEAAYSSDGLTIISGCLDDGNLRIHRLNDYKKKTGKPYTVQLIYFVPSDLSPQTDIDKKIDSLIQKVQEIYASQMEYHGFGRKTFRYETDVNGKAIIHHVKGKFKDVYYQKQSGKIWDEINTLFDTKNNIYFVALESTKDLLNGFACGFGGTNGDFGGTVVIPASGQCFNNIAVTVHEFGHAFGLVHDYRNNLKPWVDLYTNEPMTTSFCAAQWLDVHRNFNTNESFLNRPTNIQMEKPIRLTGTDDIRFKFNITDSDGLHQAQLHYPESHDSPFSKLLDFKSLSGNNEMIIFDTSLLAPDTSAVWLRTIDKRGYFTQKKFSISTTSLFPAAKSVTIPDTNLANAIRKVLSLSTENSITQLDMLNLTSLNPNGIVDLSEHQITNLTGIEYASNLTGISLSKNQIKDISPLAKLKNIRIIKLDDNIISDISIIANLKNLRELSLANNPVEDVSPVRPLLEINPDLRHDLLNRIYDVDKITGPWFWMFVPTEPNQGGANSIDIDSLATISNGVVLENVVATKGIKEGDTFGSSVWNRGEISPESDNNLNELVHKIGFLHNNNIVIKPENVFMKDHTAYGFIILHSDSNLSNVTMLVGSDDAIKVWLNGKVVYKNAINRGAVDFQNSFNVELKNGENLLLVKVSQSGYKWTMFVGIDADVTWR